MVLVLTRTYYPEGTLGIIEWKGKLLCYTIELPWLENQKRISCVPEGEYVLEKRFSPKFQWHLHLKNVPGRDLILIHPANDAKTELLGCIAPVTNIVKIGKGASSRKALEKLKKLIYPVLERNEVVKISIQSNPPIPKRTSSVSRQQ